MTTRRDFVQQVAAAACIGVTPVAAAADASDPIFAVIETHDAAMRHESACGGRVGDVEAVLPEDRKTWHLSDRRTPPENCTDAPEWIAVQTAMCDAYRRRHEAIVALLTTPPTTLAGAAALLAYLGTVEYPYEEGTEGADPMLFTFSDIADERVQEAVLAFPATLAAALGSIDALATAEA